MAATEAGRFSVYLVLLISTSLYSVEYFIDQRIMSSVRLAS